MLEWYYVLAVIGVGILTGFINTVAGSGSLISLPLLMFLGLSPATANGTNRIGILLQSFVGVAGYKKFANMQNAEWKLGLWLTIPAIIGSLIGASIAVKIEGDYLEKIIAILLVMMFFLILLKPERWLKGKEGFISKHPSIFQIVIFFIIGIYLGFIQAGVGFFLLAGLVLSVGFDLIKSNAIKVLVVFLCTPFALGVFIYSGHINYVWGLILGIGAMIGAWLATRFAAKLGNNFVRWVVLISLAIDASKMLGFFKLIGLE
jgi:uncharacterized protein